MKMKTTAEKPTICRLGKKYVSTLDSMLKNKYYFLLIAFLVCSVSCTRMKSNVANSVSPSDPIAILFQHEIAKEEATRRFLKVSPGASINAGIIRAEEPWEQEFVLECPEGEVEIGETVAQCNSPMQISFIKETSARFRLRVTIIPRLDCPDFKCVVKIPVFKEDNKEQIDLRITGKVRI